ncbi:MAG: lysophospholipid acyltransferase family protein [Candidatus Coatesbacteria bacterium]|nr:MAG: lysophospholipid acyltransferase family protein [Candidatus Coatesbacteria bacterium]
MPPKTGIPGGGQRYRTPRRLYVIFSEMVKAHHNKYFEWYFRWRLRRSLARNIFAIYADGLDGVPSQDETPTIAVANHNGWWDGLMDYYLLRETLGYSGYVMMDEEFLGTLPFLALVGGFTVDKTTLTGKAAGVRYIIRTLRRNGGTLLMYPQGRRTATDARPLGFEDGAAFIATKVARARLLPFARAYEMLAEDRPDVFYLVGEPIHVEPDDDYRELTIRTEEKVASLLDELKRRIATEGFGGFTKIYQGNLSGNKRMEKKIHAVKRLLGRADEPFEPYNP